MQLKMKTLESKVRFPSWKMFTFVHKFQLEAIYVYKKTILKTAWFSSLGYILQSPNFPKMAIIIDISRSSPNSLSPETTGLISSIGFWTKKFTLMQEALNGKSMILMLHQKLDSPKHVKKAPKIDLTQFSNPCLSGTLSSSCLWKTLQL